MAGTPGFYGDPRFKIVHNNVNFKKGYYADATGRFIPLNGMDPVHLGNGGGSPSVYYKIEDEGEDDKT